MLLGPGGRIKCSIAKSHRCNLLQPSPRVSTMARDRPNRYTVITVVCICEFNNFRYIIPNMRYSRQVAREGSSAIEELAVPQGTELFGADQAPRGLYLLRSGHVRLLGVDQVILDNLNPGSVFGEKALLGHPVLKRQTAVAVSGAKITLFKKAGLKLQLQNDPYLATRTMKALGLRLDGYEQVIRDFVRERAERRLAYLLLRIAPRRHGWVKIPFPLTNPDLSNMVGTSRWRISNLLNQFQKLGLLRRQPDLWINREALRKYLKTRQ